MDANANSLVETDSLVLTELTYGQFRQYKLSYCDDGRSYISNELHFSSLQTIAARNAILPAHETARIRTPFFVHWMRSEEEISKSSVEIQTLCALENIYHTCSW